MCLCQWWLSYQNWYTTLFVSSHSVHCVVYEDSTLPVWLGHCVKGQLCTLFNCSDYQGQRFCWKALGVLDTKVLALVTQYMYSQASNLSKPCIHCISFSVWLICFVGGFRILIWLLGGKRANLRESDFTAVDNLKTLWLFRVLLWSCTQQGSTPRSTTLLRRLAKFQLLIPTKQVATPETTPK